MDMYSVSFFGHRYIDNPFPIEKALENLIGLLLRSKDYVEFLVGRNGDFDQLVSSTIRRCQRMIRDDNSSHVWVPPYVTADFRDYEEDYRAYCDEIEVCEAAAMSHFKNAHQIRNRAVVDRSNLVVFCIQRESGGAWQTMKYANKKGVPCININEQMEELE